MINIFDDKKTKIKVNIINNTKLDNINKIIYFNSEKDETKVISKPVKRNNEKNNNETPLTTKNLINGGKSDLEIGDLVDDLEFDIMGTEMDQDMIDDQPIISDDELLDIQSDDPDNVDPSSDIKDDQLPIISKDNKHLSKDKKHPSEEKSGTIEEKYSTISIFPEDTLLDFKRKISYVSGISIYKYHLFIKINNVAIPLHYKIYSEIPININLYDIILKKYSVNVSNIPVDISLYDQKDLLFVESFDTFTTMENLFKKYNTVEFNLVSIDTFINKSIISDYFRNDPDQADLIYYGFVIKYFPMITYEVFQSYISDESEFKHMYPLLVPSSNFYDNTIKLQQEILHNKYDLLENNTSLNQTEKNLWKSFNSNFILEYKQSMNDLINVSILSAQLSLIKGFIFNNILNVRDIFDKFVLSDFKNINLIRAKLNHNNNKIIISKTKQLDELGMYYSLPDADNSIIIVIDIDLNEVRKIKNKKGKQEWKENQEPGTLQCASCGTRSTHNTHNTHNNKSGSKKGGDEETIQFIEVDDTDNLNSSEFNPIGGAEARESGKNYLYLHLFENGNYFVRSYWKEEEQITFDILTNLIFNYVNPVIQYINKLSSSLSPLIELNEYNSEYYQLGLNIIWKYQLSNNEFNDFRNFFQDDFKANLLNKPKQEEPGFFQFYYNKGIVGYDPSLIEKKIIIENYYQWLSDAKINEKWLSIYDIGRFVSISNKTIYQKIEVQKLREKEFEYFYTYLISKLFEFQLENDKNRRKIKDPKTTGKSSDINLEKKMITKKDKSLKKLVELDPELYSFKIHGSNLVYSKICQKPNQPKIYTETEINELPSNMKKNLVKYWNFTSKVPVYYYCPSSEFPHLNFITGVHPKMYCIPCCKKNPAFTDGKNKNKDNIYLSCMDKHSYEDEAIGESTRYIMNYGKLVEPGRLSKLPELIDRYIQQNLLSIAPTAKKDILTISNYYLYGIYQNLRSVDYIGGLYSLLAILNLKLNDFITIVHKFILNELMGTNPKFELLDIGIQLQPDDILEELKNTFIRNNKETIIFRSFRISSNEWNNLFFKIVKYTHNIDTIIIEDKSKYILHQSGKASEYDETDIEITTFNQISNFTKFNPNKKYIFILKKEAGSSTNYHEKRYYYYPIFKLTPQKFFKTLTIDSTLFNTQDPLMNLFETIIYQSVKLNEAAKHNIISEIEPKQGLNELNEFIKYALDNYRVYYNITKYYINRQNMCYGVIISEYKSARTYEDDIMKWNNLIKKKLTNNEKTNNMNKEISFKTQSISEIFIPIEHEYINDRPNIYLEKIVKLPFQRKNYNLLPESLIKFINAFNYYCVKLSHQNQLYRIDMKHIPNNKIPDQFNIDQDKLDNLSELFIFKCSQIKIKYVMIYTNFHQHTNTDSKSSTIKSSIIGLKNDVFEYYFNDQKVDLPINQLEGNQTKPLKIPIPGKNMFLSKSDIMFIYYEPDDVFKNIYNLENPSQDNRITKYSESFYNKYLYELMLIEYMNYFFSYKNTGVRNKLLAMIRKTNFKKESTIFKQFLGQELKLVKRDKMIIVSQLNTFLEHFNKDTFIDVINNTIYSFDTLVDYSVSKKELYDQLLGIGKKLFLVAKNVSFDVKSKDGKNAENINIFIPCSKCREKQNNPFYCKEKKLVVSKENFDTNINIITDQLHNEFTRDYIYRTITLRNIQNYFLFTKRKDEELFIISL